MAGGRDDASHFETGQGNVSASMPPRNHDAYLRRNNDEIDNATIMRLTRIVWVFFLAITMLLVWSYFAEVDEVSTGNGRVVQTSKVLKELKITRSLVVEGTTSNAEEFRLSGNVRNIYVTPQGSDTPSNGYLMEITPSDDQMLIEARISPRDITFIHPGQTAKVKITAFDYTTFGYLDGEVALVSLVTIQDKIRPAVVYYKVFIRTENDALENPAGVRTPIVPGMNVSVDIRTGKKTIFDYLTKPRNHAQKELVER